MERFLLGETFKLGQRRCTFDFHVGTASNGRRRAGLCRPRSDTSMCSHSKLGAEMGTPMAETVECPYWKNSSPRHGTPRRSSSEGNHFFLSRAHHVGGVYGVDFGDAWRPQTKPLGILEVCVCITRSLAFGAYATTIGSENEIEKRHRN